MNVYETLKNTIVIVVPVAIIVCLIFYILGYPEVALGVFIGVTGGFGKTWIMSNSVIHGTHPMMSFFLRFVVIGVAFVLGILVSIHAFFASVAGVFFVHLVFIMDQFKTSNIGELR